MAYTLTKALNASLLKSIAKTRNSMTAVKFSSKSTFETLSVTVPKPFVFHVELNRPDKLNAMNDSMSIEIGECFKQLHVDPNCRVVILSGAGKLFSAGLDFKDAIKNMSREEGSNDPAKKAKNYHKKISTYQQGMTQLELCHKPVIAGIHSACIGGAVSLITAADIRYCTKDAWFQVKEVLLGMAADAGALQRLPKIVGSDSLCRELCYTGRKMHAAEALNCGLVSRVFEDKESLMKGVLELAEDIAAKSPVAVQGTKRSFVYSRDHTVQEGLDQLAIWNQVMLQSEDFTNAVMALATKQTDITLSKL